MGGYYFLPELCYVSCIVFSCGNLTYIVLSIEYEASLYLYQDMIDMRDCYDRLLSAAAATANSVYGISMINMLSSTVHPKSSLNQFPLLSEFSESLREMGDCLLEKTALNDDEESGKHFSCLFSEGS